MRSFMKLFGKNPVIERLRAQPGSIHKIYVQEGFKDAAYIRKKAQPHGIPVFVVTQSQILKMGRTNNAQGVMVDVDDFSYTPYDELLETALQKKRCPLFLDGLNDPQNLGAIIRSLACLGKFSIVLHTHGSVDITESVLRVAAGGDNYVPVAKVSNLAQAVGRAKEKGFWIAGAVVEKGQSIFETTLPHPVALVIGSEQKGIRENIVKLLDLPITIPMALDTLSFNVAQATTIFCYEITRQKKAYEKAHESKKAARLSERD
jgi:23S rRNA (guanosine2251-2'-O)-methyltransferase